MIDTGSSSGFRCSSSSSTSSPRATQQRPFKLVRTDLDLGLGKGDGAGREWAGVEAESFCFCAPPGEVLPGRRRLYRNAQPSGSPVGVDAIGFPDQCGDG
jgi:hypothetical protein